MTNYIRVAALSELAPSELTCVFVGERRILLARVGDDVFALGDACSHRGAPLSDGVLEGHDVVCPWHMARFDVRTGHATCAPATTGVPTYPVRIQDGVIEIALPSPA